MAAGILGAEKEYNVQRVHLTSARVVIHCGDCPTQHPPKGTLRCEPASESPRLAERQVTVPPSLEVCISDKFTGATKTTGPLGTF